MKKNLASDIKINNIGIEYKEIEFVEGVILKLFNTNKPQRLEDESFIEYKIRKKLNNNQLKEFLKGELFYDKKVPYINTDKKLNKYKTKKSITKI